MTVSLAIGILVRLPRRLFAELHNPTPNTCPRMSHDAPSGASRAPRPLPSPAFANLSRRVLAGAGVLAWSTASLFAQSAPTPSPEPAGSNRSEAARATPRGAVETRAASAGNTDDASGEVVELSPFEVVANNDGYYSANTMSGTRFNTNLQDLGAAVSVVTKEQMLDFAMVDINDIFLYTVGTEGTGTYSDFVMNRNGELTDNVSLNPNTANRVRGIASANISYGNFESIGRAPLDTSVLEGVEISRGPNANVFGLGNPSGTVNQVPISGNTQRNKLRVEGRFDDYGGWRAGVDVNRVIVKDKVALRYTGLQMREGFVRKPSGLDTTRHNVALTLQPFKNTTIKALHLYYKQEGNRPNFTPPRDYRSYWVESGKPGWDPIAQQIVYADGTRKGPFINDNFLSTTDGFVFNRTGGMFQRSNVYIDQDGIFFWGTPTNNTATTPLGNTGSGATVNTDGTPRPAGFLRLMGSSPGPNGNSGRFTDQPLFNSVRSVMSRDVYDYGEVNLASPNFTSEKNETILVSLDQFFINNPTQMLAAQIAYFREDAERYREVPIGDAGTGGQNGQLWVDVNIKNLDGTNNVNFGRPFIGVNEPQFQYSPARWDTYRAQLAYRIDFTKAQGWTKWLGMHQASPYFEYKHRVERRYSYRDAMSSSHAWLYEGATGVKFNYAPANNAAITGGPQDGPAILRPFFRWYVGDANGTNIDFAPGKIDRGPHVFQWGTTGNWRNEPAQLEILATTSGTGAFNNLKRVIKTGGAVTQSFFFGGRLVATLGVRKDKVYAKQGLPLQILQNGNREHVFQQINKWEDNYRFSEGTTKTAQFVARPFRDVGVVNRWKSQGTGLQKFLGELIQGSAITYNKSDNFIPSPPAIDLFRNRLPNQTGEGDDMGLWFNLLDNKLVVRVNHYKNRQINARDGDANTIAQRVLRVDGIFATDRQGLFFRAQDWWALTNPTWTATQVDDAVFNQMQIGREQYRTLNEAAVAGTLAATNDIVGKGTELEINYNPTRNWTVSFNAEKKEAMNQNVSSTVQDWINLRMPVWLSIEDKNYNPLLTDGTAEGTGWLATPDNPQHKWYPHNYGGGSIAQTYFEGSVDAPWSIIRETEGKSRSQIRRYSARFSTNLKLAAFSDHRILKNVSVGGALRWEDKASIGWYGVETYPAKITRLDPSRPIYDDPRFYVDAFVSYRTKMFDDKVSASFRLNVRNIQEGGRLQAVGAFPNGEIHSYRIIDPRQFIFSASFDL